MPLGRWNRNYIILPKLAELDLDGDREESSEGSISREIGLNRVNYSLSPDKSGKILTHL